MIAMPHQRGFTLIEVVMVVVLIGIIAGILAPFITQSVNAYSATRSRTDLVAKGRLALERINREVRQAVPNSIKTDGNGIQFVTSRTGGRYVDLHDNFGTGINYPANNRFKKNAALTGLYILGTGYVHQANDHLVIGNTSPSDLSLVSPSAIVPLTSTPTPRDADNDTIFDSQQLSFASHRFPHDSPARHFQIADAVHEICPNLPELNWKHTPGFSGYGNSSCDATANDPVLVDGVTSVTFSYDPGTPQSSGVLRIDLQLTDGTETVDMYHEIHVRNTP